MSKGIFISGTGTEVGKTYVTSLILKKLRDKGINAGYYKAALSGAENQNGKLIAGDADYVCKVSNLKKEPNSLVSYLYETAVSPHLAARLEGNPIKINKIREDFQKIKSEFDYITVEGSGGLVCPLNMKGEHLMLTDVIKKCNLDVILVALSGLGTINSTVLSAFYAKHNRINIKGIILNQFEESSFLHQDNKKQIEYLTGIPVIACVSQDTVELDISLETLVKLYREI